MANKNYIKGRAFEYEVMKSFKEKGFRVHRTAGSHGDFDIFAVHPEQGTVEMIQCKIVTETSAQLRLIREWRDNPPLKPYILPPKTHQILAVKKVGVKGFQTATA